MKTPSRSLTVNQQLVDKGTNSLIEKLRRKYILSTEFRPALFWVQLSFSPGLVQVIPGSVLDRA